MDMNLQKLSVLPKRRTVNRVLFLKFSRRRPLVKTEWVPILFTIFGRDGDLIAFSAIVSLPGRGVANGPDGSAESGSLLKSRGG